MKKEGILFLLFFAIIISGCAVQEVPIVVQEAPIVQPPEVLPVEPEPIVPEVPTEPEVVPEVVETVTVQEPEPVVDPTSSWPECTEDQIDDCDDSCNVPDLDSLITAEQEVCANKCLFDKECYNGEYDPGIPKNVHTVMWAGHSFEVAYLDTSQYQTTGNKDITFTNSGWYAPSYSLPRSKLLDVNLNRKVKVKITANFEGEMKSTNEGCTGDCITTEKYHYSEIATYMVDESGNRQGMRVLSARQNIAQGNVKDNYQFTELTVESTDDEIIVTDSTGYTLSFDREFNYVTSGGERELNTGGNYGKLNQDQKWFLSINCHVNGEGNCKLDIKEIQVIG